MLRAKKNIMKTLIRILLIISILYLFSDNFQFAQSRVTYDEGSSLEVSTGADICADDIIINGTYNGGGTICQGPLPVTMLSFTAVIASKNNAKLEWTTAVEVNNSGFDVERRITLGGAEGWKKIGFINGSGNTSEPRSYSFEDKKLQTGSYKYRLKQIDYNGNFEYFELENDVVISPPNVFSISQNYPNPSNPKSKIDYEIPFNGKVSIKVYDILGKEAVGLLNEAKEAGYYSVEFDGKKKKREVYFYRIEVEGNAQQFAKTLKMILVK